MDDLTPQFCVLSSSGSSIGAFLPPARENILRIVRPYRLELCASGNRDAIFASAGLAGNTKNRAARKKTRGFFSPRAGFKENRPDRPAPRERFGQRLALPRSAKASANAPRAAANAAGSGTVKTSSLRLSCSFHSNDHSPDRSPPSPS